MAMEVQGLCKVWNQVEWQVTFQGGKVKHHRCIAHCLPIGRDTASRRVKVLRERIMWQE